MCLKRICLFLLDSLVCYKRNDYYGKRQNDITNLVAILYCLLVNILSCLVISIFINSPTYGCQYGVPYTGTDSCVEQELAYVHSCQSGRDTDKLTNRWDQSAEMVDAAPCLRKNSSATSTFLRSMRHMWPIRLSAKL